MIDLTASDRLGAAVFCCCFLCQALPISGNNRDTQLS